MKFNNKAGLNVTKKAQLEASKNYDLLAKRMHLKNDVQSYLKNVWNGR